MILMEVMNSWDIPDKVALEGMLKPPKTTSLGVLITPTTIFSSSGWKEFGKQGEQYKNRISVRSFTFRISYTFSNLANAFRDKYKTLH